MSAPILHFSLEYWKVALVALAPLLINISLFIYIFFYFPHNKLTRLFYYFLVPLCLWQLSDFMTRLSADQQTAAYWFYLFSPALNIVPAIGLHFTLLFTQKKNWLKNRLFLSLLYAPVFVFIFLSYGGLITFSVIASDTWRWLDVPSDDILGTINVTWIAVCSLATLGLLLHFALAKKHTVATLKCNPG